MSRSKRDKLKRQDLESKKHQASQAVERASTPTGVQANILFLQRAVGNRAVSELLHREKEGPPLAGDAVPPIVRSVLGGGGYPLDAGTRAQMETGFGQDFSHVRVHTDTQAGESAEAANALAYTVGSDVVFAEGQYAPETSAGQRLLAHELAHVVQQSLLPNRGPLLSTKLEVEARQAGDDVGAGHSARVSTPASESCMQREESKDVLDAKARAIIALAEDQKTGAEVRAVAIAKQIIKTYYSQDERLVDSVVYNNAKAGDGVVADQKFTRSSQNEESIGIIYVGDTFLSGVNKKHFARRVLQIGHEIEHIHQWRERLPGGHKKAEREFLAFFHEALLPEKPGTGRMQRSTRLRLIDASLRNFICMPSDRQHNHSAKKKELLERRAAEIASGGTPDSPDAPTECREESPRKQ